MRSSNMLTKFVLSLTIIGGLFSALTSAIAKESKKNKDSGCAQVELTLPYDFDMVTVGVNLDIDMVGKHGERAFSFLPTPASVAACNKFVRATSQELAGKFAFYDRDSFYFGVSDGKPIYVGYHQKRRTVLRLLPEEGPSKKAVVRFSLPKGKPIYIGYSVCNRDTRSWEVYTVVWTGTKPRLQYGQAASREANAYRQGGRCENFSSAWK